MKKLINNLKYILLFTIILITAFSFATNVYANENTTPSTTEAVTSMVKNITVKGGTFTTAFKAGNDTYSVYLKTFKENLDVSVELNNSRFEYTVNDNLLNRYEDNVVVVDVTDPNGEYSDEKYTLNIFFDTEGLTYLDVENGIFSPQFDKFHTTYYVILENNIDTFEKAGVNWKTANKDAVVEVECLGELNEDGTLPDGERTDYRLKVREADGTNKNYRLKLYRKTSMTSAIDENALLSSIKINGGAVEMPTFRQKQSFYDVIVPKSVDKLDIQAYPVDRSNITEVIGNTVMAENQPIYITIKVTSDKYGTCSYYTLRCQYDTMMYTESHTDLQVIAYVSFALFTGAIIGCCITLILKRKKLRNNSERNGNAVEYAETEQE